MKRVSSTTVIRTASPCALRSRRPLVHVRLVGDLHHPIKGRSTFKRTALPVGEHIGEADPTMPTRLFEGYVAGLEELDECRATHAQQVGRFLRREALMDRRNRDGLSCCHGLDDVTEHLDNFRRQDQLLPAWAGQGRRRLSRRNGPEHGDKFVKRLGRRQDRVFERGCSHLAIVLRFENVARGAKGFGYGAAIEQRKMQRIFATIVLFLLRKW